MKIGLLSFVCIWPAGQEARKSTKTVHSPLSPHC
jgi:hypothetical protein